MSSEQGEQSISAPFLVLFMRTFESEDDARELLGILTTFLLSKGTNILRAEVVKSKLHVQDEFSLSVAWTSGGRGVFQVVNDGCELTYSFDPYNNCLMPGRDPKARGIAGENFMAHWRVSGIPLRLSPILIEMT